MVQIYVMHKKNEEICNFNTVLNSHVFDKERIMGHYCYYYFSFIHSIPIPIIVIPIIRIILSWFDWSYPVITAWELDLQVFLEVQTPKNTISKLKLIQLLSSSVNIVITSLLRFQDAFFFQINCKIYLFRRNASWIKYYVRNTVNTSI